MHLLLQVLVVVTMEQGKFIVPENRAIDRPTFEALLSGSTVEKERTVKSGARNKRTKGKTRRAA
jgi:hypothetical protein